jgi:hypothetical protein
MNHDIQKDLDHIHAKVALNSAKVMEEIENNLDLSEEEYFVAITDAVCSAYQNSIITLEQV